MSGATPGGSAGPPPLTARRLTDISARLADGLPVRRKMPSWGRLHVDRALPFILLYRKPASSDPGTSALVDTVASYLLTDATKPGRDASERVLDAWAATSSAEFGTCLVVEVWAGPEASRAADGTVAPPGFVIHTRGESGLVSTVETLRSNLGRLTLAKQRAAVAVAEGSPHPPGRRAPISRVRANELGCSFLGIEVSPAFREDGEVFPIVLRKLRRRFSRAIGRALYEYVSARTDLEPEHFFQVGRRALVKPVFEMDERLANLDDSFDLLLQATPVNAEVAWRQFRRSAFQSEPVFRYRPLPIDPDEVKRALFAMRMDRIEDPTLMLLLNGKRRELDRSLTMLTDIGSPRFLYGSLQLHGDVPDDLLEEARSLLQRLPTRSRSAKRTVDAAAFADLARTEVSHYAGQAQGFESAIEVREDLYAGMLASKGALLISDSLALTPVRADALIAHEVGTHLVTYHNGLAQPLKLLHAGLPGYDALQEGLAVVSEYLAGGLDRSRLRTLAARVVATAAMTSGASFVETYRVLDSDYGFRQKTAFTIAMRVHRAGGLAKDAAYLAGLRQVLAYLAGGGDYETLFLGKFAVRHLPMVRELLLREVLVPAPYTPRVLQRPGAQERLERLRRGCSVIDLLKG